MEHILTKPNKPMDSTVFFDETGFDLYILDGNLIVSGDCTEKEAQAALDAHNVPEIKPLSIEDKLASVGLSIEELKAALG